MARLESSEIRIITVQGDEPMPDSFVKRYQRTTPETAVYRDSTRELVESATREELEWMINFLYVSLGLSGERGEIQNIAKKFLRDGPTDELKTRLFDEIGDQVYYLFEVCNLVGLDMEDIMSYNLLKLRQRKERGTLHGSGDNR